MRGLMMMVLGAMLWTASSAGSIPSYLWGELTLPAGALDSLASRVQTAGIPLASWTDEGLTFIGVEDEQELRSAETHVYLDGDVFLLAMREQSTMAVFRGRAQGAELIAMAEGAVSAPPTGFLELLESLELLAADCSVELAPRDVPLKLPRVPEDLRLDPVLWALTVHPDWLGVARDYGLERVGLRVRVVAEVTGGLGTQFEPFIQSSTETLVELLLPIPLLPDLGADPAVRLARPPYTPYPAEG